MEIKTLTEGHISGSKVVMVLVEFQARMDALLKEMKILVERVDPDWAMDFTQFPEMDAFMKTPIKPMEVPASTSSELLGSFLAQSLPNLVPELVKEAPVVPEQKQTDISIVPKFPEKMKLAERPPGVLRELSVPPCKTSQPIAPSTQPMSCKGFGWGSGKVQSDLTERWGGIPNLAHSFPG